MQRRLIMIYFDYHIRRFSICKEVIMAKELNLNDIDAQIAALKEQRKKALAEQKAAQKKEAEVRQKNIGNIVEKVLGPIGDLVLFKDILEKNKNIFVTNNTSEQTEAALDEPEFM